MRSIRQPFILSKKCSIGYNANIKATPSIAIITCYKQPDYVRAVSLRQGLRESGVFKDVIVIKNRHTNVLRYVDVLLSLLKVRVTKNPDVYLLTFRGYEILPLVLMIAIGKKVVYDEFINPYEWFVYEHHKFADGSVPAKFLRALYTWMGKRVTTILTDTPSHAAYSANLMSLPVKKYASIPVSTDENTFKPIATKPHKKFRVLYYGNMLPLHGLQYVLEAAVKLADDKDIVFHFVGGKADAQAMVQSATEQCANIEYDAWIPYEKLPETFAISDLCLGGPFGGTVQSQFVVTGKTYQFLAAARPVVVGANKESHVFTDKQDALIVPEKSADALVDAIVWAKNHPKELAALAKQGRSLYEQDFSNQRVATDLQRIFS